MVILLWSGVGGHLAVVKGWWSAIMHHVAAVRVVSYLIIILLWLGVGGHLNVVRSR